MRIAIGTDKGVIILESEGNSEWRFISHAQQERKIQCFAEGENQVIYATGSHGAIYRTEDYKNWQMSINGLVGQNITSLCIHPCNPLIMYAGTTPPELFFSNDAGVNWYQIPSFHELPSAKTWSYPEPPYYATVKKLMLHSTFPDVVLAGISQGGFLGSLDNGATWMERPLNAEREINDLDVHPQIPACLFAATSTGVYRSEDLGSTWEFTSHGLPFLYIRCLVFAPDEQNTILACVSASRVSTSKQTVVISRDCGNTWSVISRGLPSLEGEPITCVKAAGNGCFAFGTAKGNVYLTDNGGEFWSQIHRGTVPVNAILLQNSPC